MSLLFFKLDFSYKGLTSLIVTPFIKRVQDIGKVKSYNPYLFKETHLISRLQFVDVSIVKV